MNQFDNIKSSRSKFYQNYIFEIPELHNKTFAITGTSSGTGFVAAKTLARKGARVLLLNRKSDREEKAYEQIKNEYKNANIISIECDLLSFSSVRKASAIIKDLCPSGLDVLCNNAGIMAYRDQATEDGYDIQMQTNHLSHFFADKKSYSRP